MPGKYRPVGVAEKRAQLEAAGEEWPIGMDGLPKAWSSGSKSPAGGGWRTGSTRLAQNRKTSKRYSGSNKGRAASKAYRMANAEHARRYQEKYRKSDRGRMAKERHKERERQGIVASRNIQRRSAQNRRDLQRIQELLQLLPPHLREALNVSQV